MSAPETRQSATDFAAPGYAAYAQLVRMLLPSSGCLAIYAVDGDLAWCSDGFERPDLRELVEGFSGGTGSRPNQGTVRQTAAGVSALVASLADAAGEPLGYALIELGSAHAAAGNSMAASLTRPVFACLASQLALERPVAAGAPQSSDPRLAFLLGVGEIDLNSPLAIRQLLERCVEHLDCLSAVFCIPDLDLTELAERDGSPDPDTRARLDRTRRHLLAWVQLNNRPMVVNRIDSDKAPCKILSCPAVGRDGTATGLLALFRAPDSPDFEHDDVRLIEFVSRQAMVLVRERQDALTGLLSRAAFERYLEETAGASSGPGAGRLLYLDVDGLQAINDEFGFETGDEVILRMGQLIRRSLMAGRPACRLVGGRFVVHLPEQDSDAAASLGARIARAARELGYTVAGRRVPLNLRFGVAEPVGGKSGARHWIAAAERACQQARAERAEAPYNAAAR